MIKEYIKEKKDKIEEYLTKLLVSPNSEYEELYKAMNYSLLLGGKRIRPILSIMVLEAFGKSYDEYMDTLCAIELIHTYSLIHDDLPAMDNDDYRRGKLTNHKIFGDGMAILAGDGLLTYAFELLMSDKNTRATQKVEICQTLSRCAGPSGMVGGQAFDLLSESRILPIEELEILHQGKTGALFSASVIIGLILADATEEERKSYIQFASYLGLLFQITDDILDVTGTLENLGKPPGSDEQQHKATYVTIFGLDGARAKANEIAVKAINALSEVSTNHEALEELTNYLLNRTN